MLEVWANHYTSNNENPIENQAFFDFDEFYRPLWDSEDIVQRRDLLIERMDGLYSEAEEKRDFLDNLFASLTDNRYKNLFTELQEEWLDESGVANLIGLSRDEEKRIWAVIDASNKWDVEKLVELWYGSAIDKDAVTIDENVWRVKRITKRVVSWGMNLVASGISGIPLWKFEEVWTNLSRKAKNVWYDITTLNADTLLEILKMEKSDLDKFIKNIENTREDYESKIWWVAMTFTVIDFLEQKYKELLQTVNSQDTSNMDMIEKSAMDSEISKIESRLNIMSEQKMNIEYIKNVWDASTNLAWSIADNLKLRIESTKLNLEITVKQLAINARLHWATQMDEALREISKQTIGKLSDNAWELKQKHTESQLAHISNIEFLTTQAKKLDTSIKDSDKKLEWSEKRLAKAITNYREANSSLQITMENDWRLSFNQAERLANDADNQTVDWEQDFTNFRPTTTPPKDNK